MTKRDVGRMVDESFMETHSYVRAMELAGYFQAQFLEALSGGT